MRAKKSKKKRKEEERIEEEKRKADEIIERKLSLFSEKTEIEKAQSSENAIGSY